MFCRCPICGSETFYLHGHTCFASLKIAVDGTPAEINTKGGGLVVTEETVLNCLSCSWQGRVCELLASSQD